MSCFFSWLLVIFSQETNSTGAGLSSSMFQLLSGITCAEGGVRPFPPAGTRRPGRCLSALSPKLQCPLHLPEGGHPCGLTRNGAHCGFVTALIGSRSPVVSTLLRIKSDTISSPEGSWDLNTGKLWGGALLSSLTPSVSNVGLSGDGDCCTFGLSSSSLSSKKEYT